MKIKKSFWLEEAQVKQIEKESKKFTSESEYLRKILDEKFKGNIFKSVKANIPNKQCTQPSTMPLHKFVLGVKELGQLSSVSKTITT
jgi:hypothetical protein